MSVNINSTAILNTYQLDSRCINKEVSRNKAINLMEMEHYKILVFYHIQNVWRNSIFGDNKTKRKYRYPRPFNFDDFCDLDDIIVEVSEMIQ